MAGCNINRQQKHALARAYHKKREVEKEEEVMAYDVERELGRQGKGHRVIF